MSTSRERLERNREEEEEGKGREDKTGNGQMER
jgi:hypothetical protein